MEQSFDFKVLSAASLTNFFRSSFALPSDHHQGLATQSGPSISGGMDRLPLPLPFCPDIWRSFPPNPFLQNRLPTSGSSPLETHVKSGLPDGLSGDPRGWTREDVVQFLNYCEREFDLEKIDLDKFQMNGKALCFLSKNDLAERCSGAGDVIHNILQMLLRDSSMPLIIPRPPGLMTPPSPSPFTHHSWPLLNSSANETFPNLSHLISKTDSVTLSPAPSPNQDMRHLSPLYLPSHLQMPQGDTSTGPASSHSDSEDSLNDPQRSPTIPAAPASQATPRFTPTAPSSSSSSRETDQEAPSSNRQLLWDFLQQLLNDAGQRYTSYIAWKNKETGVFKIVDPNGLARLWGIQKNHLSMNYDKMSRALRYYYRVNILRKVQGERHCYQFLRNPSELKSIKNISLLRQQIEAQAAAQQMAAQQAAQQAVLSSCRSKEEVFSKCQSAAQEAAQHVKDCRSAAQEAAKHTVFSSLSRSSENEAAQQAFFNSCRSSIKSEAPSPEPQQTPDDEPQDLSVFCSR